MSTDALAPYVAMPSADMVLTIHDERAFVFIEERSQLAILSRTDRKQKYIFISHQIISVQGLIIIHYREPHTIIMKEINSPGMLPILGYWS